MATRSRCTFEILKLHASVLTLSRCSRSALTVITVTFWHRDVSLNITLDWTVWLDKPMLFAKGELLMSEPQRNLTVDSLEVVEGRERDQIQGWVPELASDAELRDALEKAFDYRGDVTITRKDGTKVEGYIFDRRNGATLADSVVRIIPQNSREKIAIAYSDIAALAFTGRDTAAGKSWEAWVRKYWEKKAAGEKHIALEPENLE